MSVVAEIAKRNSRQRIDPLIEDCVALKNIVSSPRSCDKGNTFLSKDFQGGILVPQVKMPKLINFESESADWQAKVPSLIMENWHE